MGVFISYCSKDSEFVEKLCETLIQKHVGVWLDKWEMRPGDSLIDKIQNGIESSSHLLVVLSPNYIQSEWCKKEQNAGIMKEIKAKEIILIPILLEDCEIPIFLQEKVYADFRKDFSSGFSELYGSLSRIANEHMGQFYNNGLVVDFAFNWGLLDDSLVVNLDFINFLEKANRTFLLQVEIKGNELVTQRFIEHTLNNRGWIILESILLVLYEHPQLYDLTIRIKNDEPYFHRIGIKDISTEQIYYMTIRAVLMGVDDGHDIMIHFNDYTRKIMEDRKERFSDYKH